MTDIDRTSNPPRGAHPPKLRTAFRRRERRYPIWSAKAIMGVGLLAVAVATILTLTLGHRSLLVELEMTLTVVAIGLFLFLAIGLYSGARVKKHEPLAGELKLYGGDGLGDHASGLEIPDIGGGDDVLGCLLAIVVGILGTLLVILLLFLFINLAIVVVFLFMVAVGWIFHRALRNVFAKSKRCRGDILASTGYAAFYTVLYTGWLLAILLGVDWLKSR